MNTKYELVVVIDAHMAQSQKDDVLKQSTDAVVKGGGKVINSQVWLEKHKFTFILQKKTDGTYYLINFESNGAGIDKIKENLRLNESILRYAIFRTN